MIEISFRQKIKGKILEYKISTSTLLIILGAIGWLIKKSYFFHSEVFQIWIKNHIPLLVFATTLITILLSFSFVYIFFQHNKIKKFKKQIEQLNKLKFEFHVYWDKDLYPYCSRCFTPLTVHSDSKFACYKCNRHINITDEDMKPMTLKEARNRLRKLNQP